MSNWEEYNKAFLTDGIRFLIGRKLGGGCTREVYVYAGNEDFVVKIETESSDMFQNVIEYDLWKDAQHHPDMRKWLAPCIRISPHGNYMIQERTMPVTLKELKKRIKMVPVWCADLKDANWGRLPNGRIVCHDYGTHGANRFTSQRLQKAHWWD